MLAPDSTTALIEQLVAVDRILVLGAPGSGKSSLGRLLARALGRPCHHLDDLYWLPGWQRVAPALFEERQRACAAGARWVIEGMHAPSLGLRLARAQVVILLDQARHRVLWQFLCRGVERRLGCRRTLPTPLQAAPWRTWLWGWRPEGRVWQTIWAFRTVTLPQVQAQLQQEQARRQDLHVVVLRSVKACEALRERLRQHTATALTT